MGLSKLNPSIDIPALTRPLCGWPSKIQSSHNMSFAPVKLFPLKVWRQQYCMSSIGKTAGLTDINGLAGLSLRQVETWYVLIAKLESTTLYDQGDGGCHLVACWLLYPLAC